MKKLIISVLVIFLSIPVFAQAPPQAPKVFQIHSEKRPFIKKGDRKRKKGHRHHIRKKMHDKKHIGESHKK
jgi:hypothetical protein